MTAFIAWKDYYTVNERSLDAEHKQIIEIINTLYTAMQRHAENHVMQDVLARLANYTMTHFAHEEEHMLAAGYADFDTHKVLHDRMRQRTLELQTHMDAVSAPAVLLYLKDWWVNHIQGADKQYAPWMATAAETKA